MGEIGPMDVACRVVAEKADFELSASGFPHILAGMLGCPVIMPLFPRPQEGESNIYTHALTSMAMAVSDPPLAWVDLQLIAMFQDIKNRFAGAGINLCDKFIVKGFSAGGRFADRFTLLHPRYVLAALGGGNKHSFTLPLRAYQNETLLWPNGIGNADFTEDFDYECYKGVSSLPLLPAAVLRSLRGLLRWHNIMRSVPYCLWHLYLLRISAASRQIRSFRL